MGALKSRTMTCLAAAFCAGGLVLTARCAEAKTDKIEETTSHLGSYLAGRHARGVHDTGAAATYYRQTLQRDPTNDVLAEQAFMMEAAEGNWDRAIKLARQLGEGSAQNRIARMALGVSEFKAGNIEKADEHFKAAGTGPIAELTSALARAWVKAAQNEAHAAIALLDTPKQAEWAQFYLRYHRALIADVGGRRAEARATYERLFKQDARTPRTALAYAQHAANAGDAKLARAVLKEHADKSTTGEGHPMTLALKERIDSGAKIEMLVENARDGLAEVFYGLGEALTGEGGIGVGAVYLQMALYLRPDFPFALAALANVYETTKHYEDAIAVYDRIPKGTPLQASIDIRKAINLNLLEKVDEAKTLLEDVARREPGDVKPLDALGSIMRARKRYDEAVDYYSRAIALIPKPDKKHWTYWYSRGTCYERTKRWPLAEADLQRALQLAPEQPLILNYLGYSWVDQNRNLKQGMALIEKAVSLKPDDGYIVDSLGWAHFKQGNFKDAVRYLERAVELRPEDPVLNDHLGDSLWRVGRQREARFQWDQALTLKPEPEDMEEIKRKLIEGLPEIAPQRALKKARQVQRPDQPRKRVETKAAPGASVPQ